MPEPSALLAVEGLEAWYGELHALHGVGFNVQAGEVVTLLGRNGVGKTTTLKAIMGIIERRTGSVRFEGRELIRLSSDTIARRGIAFRLEERGIFASLDAEEVPAAAAGPPGAGSGSIGSSSCFPICANGSRARA